MIELLIIAIVIIPLFYYLVLKVPHKKKVFTENFLMKIENKDQYDELKPELEKLGYKVGDFNLYRDTYIFNETERPEDFNKYSYTFVRGTFDIPTNRIKVDNGVRGFYLRKRIMEYDKDKFLELASRYKYVYEKG